MEDNVGIVKPDDVLGRVGFRGCPRLEAKIVYIPLDSRADIRGDMVKVIEAMVPVTGIDFKQFVVGSIEIHIVGLAEGRCGRLKTNTVALQPFALIGPIHAAPAHVGGD